MACGTPVVATAVGGIPEQVNGLGTLENLPGGWNSYPLTGATGILVPSGDPRAMAEAAIYLLNNSDICQNLGQNAARDAIRRFDLEEHAEAYLEWYKEILMERNAKVGNHKKPVLSVRRY